MSPNRHIRSGNNYKDAIAIPYGTSAITNSNKGNTDDKQLTILLKERKSVLRTMLAGCAKVDPSFKSSKAFIDTILKAVESLDSKSAIYSTGYDYGLQQLNTYCVSMSDFDKIDPNCASCSSNQSFYLNNQYVAKETLKSMLKTPQDKDNYLLDLMQNYFQLSTLTQNSGSSGSSTYDCSGYDPFATANEIAKLLKNSCVKTIYVTDPWLIKKFVGQEKKVIYRPFIDDDIYAVETNSSTCSSTGVAK